MRKDGTWSTSLALTWPRIGWTCISGRTVKASPSRATAKLWRRWWSACGARSHPGRLEATGGYETVVASAIGAAGLPLAVVNPRQIRDFARATGKLAKTDRIDAAAIAHFAEAVRPPARPIADAEAQALGELVARRRQVIEMIVAEGNRRRMATPAPGPQGDRPASRAVADRTLRTRGDIDGAIRKSSGLAGRRRSPGQRSRCRQGDAAHPDRRAARTRPPRSPQDRRPRRGGADQPRQRHPARPPHHRRRPLRRAHRASSWPPWSPAASTRSSPPTTTNCAPPAKPLSRPSPPACESSSSSSMPSCETANHGNPLDITDSRSG